MLTKSFQQAPMIEQINATPRDAERLRQPSWLREPLEYNCAGSCESKLAGEHQSGRSTADDDHVFDHFRLPLIARLSIGSSLLNESSAVPQYPPASTPPHRRPARDARPASPHHR